MSRSDLSPCGSHRGRGAIPLRLPVTAQGLENESREVESPDAGPRLRIPLMELSAGVGERPAYRQCRFDLMDLAGEEQRLSV
jgi:hypothetical protein